MKLSELKQIIAEEIEAALDEVLGSEESTENAKEIKEEKPSAGLTKKQKRKIVKKAKAGKDIGKPGKGFEKVKKAAEKSGAKDPEAVAAAAMWKSAKR